jgi:hypothetical protein
MVSSMLWFGVLATVAMASWAAGWGSARRGAAWGRLAVAVGLLWLATWIVLQQRPDVAVRLIPSGMLSQIEGTAAVPAFMLIVGAAMAAAALPRQRVLARVSTLIGVVFFAYGGMWMLQPAPTLGAAPQRSGPVLQSTDYTCVAAASATALGMVGIDAGEAEMARLTATRPIYGSTLLRAYAGLERKLDHADHRPVLVQASLDDLHTLPAPALTALSLGTASRHMVVILGTTDRSVYIFDPNVGNRHVPLAEFRRAFSGHAILLVPRGW